MNISVRCEICEKPITSGQFYGRTMDDEHQWHWFHKECKEAEQQKLEAEQNG